MHNANGKWMSPFEVYLRTGRSLPNSNTISLKFNPWHDPDDGKFTFRDQGVNYGGGPTAGVGNSSSAMSPKPRRPGFGGFGGGGRGVNGGGASGEIPKPEREPTRKTTSATPPASKPVHNSLANVPGRRGQGPTLKPETAPNPIRHIVDRNGYRFGLDEKKRTLVVTGNLKFPDATERSKTQQRRAGESDRRSDDDGGHFIAARFGGPKDAFNHFAQNASFNRGGYRVMEGGWAKELRAGKGVFVDISVSYPTNSRRPRGLVVQWIVDGVRHKQRFSNKKDHSK